MYVWKILRKFSCHWPIRHNKMKTKQQAKKISSGQREKSVLWINELNNEGSRVQGMKLPRRWYGLHKPTLYIVLCGWFKESARHILPYRLNVELNHKMPSYSSYVFKALFSINLWGSIEDQINNLATGTFHNWHTCCSENHLHWLTLKTCEKVICSYQTWKCEKVFICIFRWQTLHSQFINRCWRIRKVGGGRGVMVMMMRI